MTSEDDKVLRRALVLSALLLFLLFTAHFFRNLTGVSSLFSIAIILFELVLPLETLKASKISPEKYNIYAHRIDTILDVFLPPYGIKKIRPDFHALARELKNLLFIIVITIIPYIFLYLAFQQLLAIHNEQELHFVLNFPPRFFYELLTQIFVVALPEELFYRGFLQGALVKRFPYKRAGLPLTAFFFTNLIFAIGHLAVYFSPFRLLTFFPGLIFSYLVYKNKSLVAAILFHALCNILGQILYASFFLR